MTLMLPQLIDDLEGRIPRSSLLYVTGEKAPLKSAAEEFVRLARGAEKFDFGALALEENLDKIVAGRPVWHTPVLTPVELEAWNDGLIPLPAETCWYEFILGGERTGLMLNNTADGLEVLRVDYNAKRASGVFDGCWARKRDGVFGNGLGSYMVRGPKVAIDAVDDIRRKSGGKILNYAADYYMAVYLTMMLVSRTTEKSMHVPSLSMNKARERRGDEPMHVHRIVNLTPRRFVYDSSGKGTHASPRMHWRRSHVRTFDHPTPLGKHIEGRGWCVLIPRSLIGREESGTVEHEYKVRT